jgi:hypothetical protein
MFKTVLMISFLSVTITANAIRIRPLKDPFLLNSVCKKILMSSGHISFSLMVYFWGFLFRFHFQMFEKPLIGPDCMVLLFWACLMH